MGLMDFWEDVQGLVKRNISQLCLMSILKVVVVVVVDVVVAVAVAAAAAAGVVVVVVVVSGLVLVYFVFCCSFFCFLFCMLFFLFCTCCTASTGFTPFHQTPSSTLQRAGPEPEGTNGCISSRIRHEVIYTDTPWTCSKCGRKCQTY